MKGIGYEISKRVAVKDLIEEMREEMAIERGEKYIKPVDKPKGKPKRPLNPNPIKPKRRKKDNIFAKKYPKRNKNSLPKVLVSKPMFKTKKQYEKWKQKNHQESWQCVGCE